jgi:hypothetical protein
VTALGPPHSGRVHVGQGNQGDEAGQSLSKEM